jgi:hypothetical protein
LPYRTNNYSEGYNSAFKKAVQANPSPLKCLDVIMNQMEQSLWQYRVDVVKQITEKPSQSKLTPILNQILPKLLQGEIDMRQFLMALSNKKQKNKKN